MQGFQTELDYRDIEDALDLIKVMSSKNKNINLNELTHSLLLKLSTRICQKLAYIFICLEGLITSQEAKDSKDSVHDISDENHLFKIHFIEKAVCIQQKQKVDKDNHFGEKHLSKLPGHQLLKDIFGTESFEGDEARTKLKDYVDTTFKQVRADLR